jgi:hypothetical protein
VELYLHSPNTPSWCGANLFYNEDSILTLAYLQDIFEKLSNVNKAMQGPKINILDSE